MNSNERRRSKLWLPLAGTTLIIVAMFVLWRTVWAPPTIVAVPAVNLTSSPPAVRSAITQALKDVEEEPRSGTAWGELGMILFAHQFETEANQCFEQAMALEPAEFRWPYLLGLNQTVADRRTAADHFQRAVQLNEELGVAHCRLGELLLDLGDLSKAEEHLKIAMKLQRDDARPPAALARLNQLQGRMDDALELAERAVRLAPQQRATHELLASIRQRRGERAEALKHLQIAESLPVNPLPWHDPVAAEVVDLRKDAGWLLEQAQGLVGAGRLIEAVQLLRDASQGDSQDPRIISALGRALVQSNSMGEAQRVLTEAARAHPDSAEIAFQLGVAYFFDNQFAKAAEAFESAIRLKSDYALAHFNMGHALEKLDDKPGALAAFRKAARYRPSYAAAHTNAGRLLLEAGDAPAAIECLRQSVRLIPQDHVARELLDRAVRQGSP